MGAMKTMAFEIQKDLARILLLKGENAAALKILDQANKKFPEDSMVSGNLAWLLLESGKDFDRALGLARTANENSSGKAYLMDTLGWAYFHKKAFSRGGRGG